MPSSGSTVGASYQVSNADSLTDLSGGLADYSGTGYAGDVSVGGSFFVGNNGGGESIYGGQIGVSVGPAAGGYAAANYTYAWMQQIHNPMAAFSLKLLFDSLLPPGSTRPQHSSTSTVRYGKASELVRRPGEFAVPRSRHRCGSRRPRAYDRLGADAPSAEHGRAAPDEVGVSTAVGLADAAIPGVDSASWLDA